MLDFYKLGYDLRIQLLILYLHCVLVLQCIFGFKMVFHNHTVNKIMLYREFCPLQAK